ncbi:hypothetical protein CR513_20721, partial [Mucuna pruriens]
MRLLQEQTSIPIILHHHASNDLAFSVSSFDSLCNCWLVKSFYGSFSCYHKTFSLVVQEEKQQETGASTSSNVFHAFTVTTASNKKRKGTKKDHPLCAYCGILGHTQDRCYKFHGYPPNYKKNKVSSESVNQDSTLSTTPYF